VTVYRLSQEVVFLAWFVTVILLAEFATYGPGAVMRPDSFVYFGNI